MKSHSSNFTSCPNSGQKPNVIKKLIRKFCPASHLIKNLIRPLVSDQICDFEVKQICSKSRPAIYDLKYQMFAICLGIGHISIRKNEILAFIFQKHRIVMGILNIVMRPLNRPMS